MPRFIGEKITVETTGTVKQPTRFTWRATVYEIDEIILAWSDWNFPAGSTQRSWRTRRHRNYYRVRTSSGEQFELYLDRSRDPRGDWYLYQQLEA